MAKRWPYRQQQYASARGRNGRFVPRLLECEFSDAEDGTPLITLRIYSRRESVTAPIELTIAVIDWEIQALGIQLAVNERRRQLASGRHDFANDP